MFVDASALVAVMALEPGWEPFLAAIGSGPSRVTSPIAVFEAAQAIARKNLIGLDRASGDVRAFLDESGVEVIEMTEDDGYAACEAHRRFGKGRQPAALNMGDCFAYACAIRLGVPLLYKGNDFSQTDILSAMDAR